ncbi:hypothetical protein Tcan_17127 [Toxocara canis]|uniref:Insulin-like domain-containing protein n=1 Tax=Toxocara canis TaxID=6265 RepID=A0A0B2UVG7_TOXCA|nr:hypothetical protein Tcan_17127 [Toxocara canis]
MCTCVYAQVRVPIFCMLIMSALCRGMGLRLCGEDLQEAMIRICTFADQKSPCFKAPLAPSEPAIETGYRLREGSLMSRCCEKNCTLDDLRTACCFSLRCLQRCYPLSAYGRHFRQ